MFHTIKITISYDGTRYSGWQIQPNAVTIQELVQKAVRSMTGEENNVVASGRTDAGVHALAQVASFKTERDIPLDGFRRGLNTELPRDIRIDRVEEAGGDFHPIRDAKSKHYRYLISEAAEEHPLELNRVWCVGRKLNVEAMKKAAEFLIGEHDFSAFRAADACDNGAVREIYSVDLKIPPHPPFSKGGKDVELLFADGERGTSFPFSKGGKDALPPFFNVGRDVSPPLKKGGEGGFLSIDITGSGFLKNMVRNIAGTLVDVGLEKITPAGFKQILESKDRKKAGVCAPACGLYLVRVEY